MQSSARLLEGPPRQVGSHADRMCAVASIVRPFQRCLSLLKAKDHLAIPLKNAAYLK